MLFWLPAPLHRAGLRLAHGARLLWWQRPGRDVHGCNVVVSDASGAVLLLRHSYQAPDQWMLPGGGVARGESAEAAAIREVLEETGCRIADVRHFGVDVVALGARRNRVELLAATTPDFPRADRREIVEARFFATEALPDALTGAARWRIGQWQCWRQAQPAEALDACPG